jgi:hypothetical protein
MERHKEEEKEEERKISHERERGNNFLIIK